jgi:hypothetical protein
MFEKIILSITLTLSLYVSVQFRSPQRNLVNQQIRMQPVEIVFDWWNFRPFMVTN